MTCDQRGCQGEDLGRNERIIIIFYHSLFYVLFCDHLAPNYPETLSASYKRVDNEEKCTNNGKLIRNDGMTNNERIMKYQ